MRAPARLEVNFSALSSRLRSSVATRSRSAFAVMPGAIAISVLRSGRSAHSSSATSAASALMSTRCDLEFVLADARKLEQLVDDACDVVRVGAHAGEVLARLR